MKTLLIEPNLEKRRTLSDALTRRGHQVTVVADGEAACAALQEEMHPLVFIGVDCLGDTPTGVCGQLRTAPHGRQCLLIALAERDDPGHLEKLLAAGADDYLALPAEDRVLALRFTVFERRAHIAGRRQPAEVAVDDAGGQRGADGSLPEINQQLQAIFENAVDGILLADIQTKQFYLGNPMICRMLGYRQEEIRTLGVAEIHPQKELPHVLEQFEKQARGEFTLAKDIPMKRKDGSVFYADANSFPITLAGREYLTGIFRDATERRRAEEALRESEERYRLIADNATDMIWTARVEGISEMLERMRPDAALQVAQELVSRWQFTYISPAVERMLGYRVDEAMAIRLKDLLTGDAHERSIQVLAEELAAERQPGRDPGRQRVLELQHIAKYGGMKWCEVTTTFLRDEEDRVAGILGVTRDITGRRQAEAALRESESTLRGLVENMPDVVVMFGRDGTVQYVNRTTSGTPISEILGSDAFGFAAPEHRKLCRQAVQRALQTGEAQPVNALDVFGRWWDCRIVPLVRDGEVRNAMVIITDITEKKKAEEAIHKEQELLRQMLDLHERDRELLAYELHDGFVQLLAGAMMNFQAAGQLQETAPDRAQSNFQQGTRLLRESIDESRRLISGLRPPVLEQFGIMAAVEHLVGESQALGGQEIEFISKGRFQRLARPLESAIFRIVQETLTNARRHSQSDRVRVELARQQDHVCIQVQDWGVGFEPAGVHERCFGIQGIRERARLLGGEAEIQTAPGSGTQVTVRLPLVYRSQDATRDVGAEPDVPLKWPGAPDQPAD